MPSVGVAMAGAGGGGGSQGSQVEGIAAKREKLESKRTALLQQADDALQERATVADLIDSLAYGPEREKMNVLKGRYLQGLRWEQVARCEGVPASRCKRVEREGLLSLASVMWGLQADGCIYDEHGLYYMTDEQRQKSAERHHKRWE